MINEKSPVLTDEEARVALEKCIEQVRRNLGEFTTKSQNHSSVNNFYPACENNQWTTGFWPGEIWLAYEYTKDEAFKNAALEHVKSMNFRIENKISVDHHDMGFLYSPTCVAAWKLVKSETGRKAAIQAADQLISRFQSKGNFIQAWGELGAKDNYRYIVDCLLNTPLLYWATRETGDKKYAEIARLHTQTCMKNSIRADGSTFHTFFMDSVTGEPLYGRTCQGYADDSVWARGQSWGVYGSSLAYRYDRNEEYLKSFHRTVDFYLSKLPSDNVPYWDMIFNDENATHDGETEPRDSSSNCIVACGLLDMASQTGDKELERKARILLKALVESYAVKDFTKSNGLLLHGTYSKKSPYNTCTPEGVDECTSWGDYFYMEALTRIVNPDWELYW